MQWLMLQLSLVLRGKKCCEEHLLAQLTSYYVSRRLRYCINVKFNGINKCIVVV